MFEPLDSSIIPSLIFLLIAHVVGEAISFCVRKNVASNPTERLSLIHSSESVTTLQVNDYLKNKRSKPEKNTDLHAGVIVSSEFKKNGISPIQDIDTLSRDAESTISSQNTQTGVISLENEGSIPASEQPILTMNDLIKCFDALWSLKPHPLNKSKGQ
jgi:hypothetical protein